MTLDALRLEVPTILDGEAASLADLNNSLSAARLLPIDQALQEVLSLLFRLNRSAMTLLERQRALQSFSDAYRYLAQQQPLGESPAPLFLRLCSELAIGFKRLLLQILQGRQPSRPHLAWCLYMAQHFLAQCLLRHYQLYQEPPASLWRDSHLLYWLAERQECLDEPVAAAFQPTPASTQRGIYQQMLLLALSNPFHLAEGECALLFGALAPLAELGRLLPWEDDDESGGPVVDLSHAQACLGYGQQPAGQPDYLRHFELGALLIALLEPAPLRTAAQRQVLDKVQQHWQGRQQRRHPRIDYDIPCHLVSGLSQIHAHLLEQHPDRAHAQMLDASPGGAGVLCSANQAQQLGVGQLVLLLNEPSAPILALVRWRHLNARGLHLGLRYLKGLPRPVWLRRAPSAQTHVGVLQSTPEPGSGWHHGLWLPSDQFGEGENLWLQLAGVHNQATLTLANTNLHTTHVSRYPMRLT